MAQHGPSLSRPLSPPLPFSSPPPLFLKVLCNLYGKTLSALSRLPKEAAYRRYTEQVVLQRLQVVQGETDVVAVEEKIGCGQVEELIDQVGQLKVTRLYGSGMHTCVVCVCVALMGLHVAFLCGCHCACSVGGGSGSVCLRQVGHLYASWFLCMLVQCCEYSTDCVCV